MILPKTIEEYIDANNPTRFIDAYVDTLDKVHLGFKHSRPNEVGRPPYNPVDMLKLFIHGYCGAHAKQPCIGRSLQDKLGDRLADERTDTRFQDDSRFQKR